MARYSYNYKEKPRKKNHFAALVMCMAALGALSWYALDFAATVPSDKDTSSNTTSSPSGFLMDTVSGRPGPVSSKQPTEDEPPKVSSEPKEEPPEEPVSSSLPAATTEATFFVKPVAGAVQKEYSPQSPLYSETFLDFRVHSGVDISAKPNDVVGAAGHGVVRAVRQDERLGNIVEIDHGNGIVCFYCGLNEHIMVEEGQNVEPSQPIGTIGTVPEECVDAPHLHLQVLKNGNPASPVEILGLK